MKRNEVEAILKIEDGELVLRVMPFLYRGKIKRVYEEYWQAEIGVLSPENQFIPVSAGHGDTNHQAASNAYKQFKIDEARFANHK